MAFRHFTVTLLATETRAISAHLPVSFVRVENVAGNDIVRWGQSGLTTIDYGGSVAAGAASEEIGPVPHGLMNLDQIYFLGTTDDVIHLTVITP